MTHKEADIRRIFDAKANFHGERLIRGQWGKTTDTNELVTRDYEGNYQFGVMVPAEGLVMSASAAIDMKRHAKINMELGSQINIDGELSLRGTVFRSHGRGGWQGLNGGFGVFSDIPALTKMGDNTIDGMTRVYFVTTAGSDNPASITGIPPQAWRDRITIGDIFYFIAAVPGSNGCRVNYMDGLLTDTQTVAANFQALALMFVGYSSAGVPRFIRIN
jgi:hypothetical protein